jgi:hypothetical protein
MLHVMGAATSTYMPRTTVGPVLLIAVVALVASSACAPPRAGDRSCNTGFECGNQEVCSYGICMKAPRPTYGPEGEGPDAEGPDGEGDDPIDPVLPPVVGKPGDDPVPTRFDLTFDAAEHATDDLHASPFAVHLAPGHPLLAQMLDGRAVKLMAMHAGEPLELALDVERFDDGGALLWSRLPTARAGVTEVWFETTASDQDVEDRRAEVWTGFDAVYHLAGHAADATGRWAPFVAHGTDVVTDCALGGCRTFDGDDWIDLASPDGASIPWLSDVDGFTLEVWVRRDGDSGEVLSIGTGLTGTAPTASRATLMYREGQPAGFARAPDALGQKRSMALEADTAGDWHHLALVVRLPGEAGGMGNVRLYEDGEEVAYAEGPEHLFEEAATSPEGAQLAALGADDDGQSLWFVGALDEVRIKPSPTSVAQLRASAWVASAGYASVGEGVVAD